MRSPLWVIITSCSLPHALLTMITDAWFVEDEKLLGPHPKDPYKRVETIPSSREIRIEIDGEVIAKSTQNVFLYETLLRTRYYLTSTAVEWKFLGESDTTSYCPYKGMAKYLVPLCRHGGINANGETVITMSRSTERKSKTPSGITNIQQRNPHWLQAGCASTMRRSMFLLMESWRRSD